MLKWCKDGWIYTKMQEQQRRRRKRHEKILVVGDKELLTHHILIVFMDFLDVECLYRKMLQQDPHKSHGITN